MSETLIGKLEHKFLGLGVWVLITSEGKTYQLYKPPAELLKIQDKVKIRGKIRDDIMTVSMFGPILEVIDFEKLS